MSKLAIEHLQRLSFAKFTSPVNSGLVVNKTSDGSIAELRLYSPIGAMFDGGISGARVAEEIEYLSGVVETIIIRVNTYGGSVAEGMSIMSAMLKSKAKIICIIDGIAASIGAVIAICANETHIVDYGLVMIHTTNYTSGEGDSSVLEKFDDALSLVFQTRLNKTPEQVAEFFVKGKDTWMNADEAKEAGVVNSIIPTVARELVNQAKEILLTPAPGVDELFTVMNFYNQSQNKNQMNKEVLNALGLSEQADSAGVLNAISSLKGQVTAKEVVIASQTEEITNKVAEITNLQTKLTAFEAAENTRKEAEVKDVVNAAVTARKIANNAESIERWTKLAKADITSVKEALNSLTASPKLSDLIKGDAKDTEVEFKPIRVSEIIDSINARNK